MPPTDIKRPAIKKQMHCVEFFGTKDFAWIEETGIKPYEEFKNTLIRDKKSKSMSQAIDEIEKYCKSRPAGNDIAPPISVGTNLKQDEEFDALFSEKTEKTKVRVYKAIFSPQFISNYFENLVTF